MNTVYPIGYSADGAAAVLDRLMTQPQMLLIDTRFSPNSRYPQWRESALREKFALRYRRAGAYLGNENFAGGPIKIVNPERGIAGLCQYLEEGYDLVLLCQCADYQTCHRHMIVDLLQKQRPSVQVVQPVALPEDTAVYQCLSIQPPYAHWLSNPALFIDAGIRPKVIENRNWNTAYRGFLLLHASKTFDPDALDAWVGRCPQMEGVVPMKESEYVKGAIVGCAELVDVIRSSSDPWFIGPYGFVLANARPLIEPIPLRGMLKVFPVARSLVDEKFV